MPSIYYQLALLQCYGLNFSLFMYVHREKRETFFRSVNIDAMILGVPLFERAVKNDVLAVLLVYEVYYRESNRYCNITCAASKFYGNNEFLSVISGQILWRYDIPPVS